MALDWNFLPSLISAASGLGGVWLGGRLTYKREASRENERNKKEASYLAILVTAHLDRFVNGCLQVSFDDGTSDGQPAGNDGVYHMATVAVPSFDPLALSVDWKVLPASLMYSILNLPYQIEVLNNKIAGVSEFDNPPDFAETFCARQYGFAVLGLEVSELTRQLSLHAGLPIHTLVEGEWNRDDFLKRKIDEIDNERATYEARRAASQGITTDV